MRLQVVLILALGLAMPGAFADQPDESPKGKAAEKHELKKAQKEKAEERTEKSREKAPKEEAPGDRMLPNPCHGDQPPSWCK